MLYILVSYGIVISWSGRAGMFYDAPYVKAVGRCSHRKKSPLCSLPPPLPRCIEGCLSQAIQRTIFMCHWKPFTKYVLRCSMYILFSYPINGRCIDLADIFYYDLKGGNSLYMSFHFSVLFFFFFKWPQTLIEIWRRMTNDACNILKSVTRTYNDIICKSFVQGQVCSIWPTFSHKTYAYSPDIFKQRSMRMFLIFEFEHGKDTFWYKKNVYN
jgi:hypothetical protein